MTEDAGQSLVMPAHLGVQEAEGWRTTLLQALDQPGGPPGLDLDGAVPVTVPALQLLVSYDRSLTQRGQSAVFGTQARAALNLHGIGGAA